MNLKRIPVLFALLCGAALVYGTIQYLLVAKSYQLEKRNFDAYTHMLVRESFYQIRFSHDSIVSMSGEIYKNHILLNKPLPMTVVQRYLQRALVNYKQMGSLLGERLLKEKIAIPFKFAVTVNVFHIHLDSRPKVAVIDVIKRGDEPRLFGNLENFGKAHSAASFFANSGNAYTQINVYVDFHNVSGYIWSRINDLVVISAIAALVILVVFVLTVLTILKQKKLSDMKSDFINNITHELNTPLSTIGVATKGLKKLSNEEDIRDLAMVIGRQNQRLQGIVERVMDLSFGNQGELESCLEEVRIEDLLKILVKDFSFARQAEGLTVSEKYQTGDVFVSLDPNLFATAFLNILDNSLKYCTQAPQITVISRQTGPEVEIHIIDNGIGIKSANLKKIFDKFYRITEGQINRTRGLGIGLSISRQIVEAHGGTVTATSQKGKGSTIKIILPIARSQEDLSMTEKDEK